MINSSDGFVITEHREPPHHGQLNHPIIEKLIFAENATFQLDKWTRVQRSNFLIKMKIVRFL